VLATWHISSKLCLLAALFHMKHHNHLQLFGEALSSQEHGITPLVILKRVYHMPTILAQSVDVVQ
jgi:hypothetical protein